jgi:hypothetical protein
LLLHRRDRQRPGAAHYRVFVILLRDRAGLHDCFDDLPGRRAAHPAIPGDKGEETLTSVAQEEMKMMAWKRRLLFLGSLFFLCFPTGVSAEVWSSSCARAINDLKKIQQEVSSVYEKYDSAKFNLEVEKRMLDLCVSDCRREQETVNRRARDYNEGVKELKKALGDFESALNSFQSQCLKGKPSG